MSDYSAFFLMKPEDVKRYAVDVLHFFQPDEETDCVEIGDGNINYVFQVRSRRDGRSVIVKQADKLLRSSGRPLDLYPQQDRGGDPDAGGPAGSQIHPGGLSLR